MKEQIKNLEKAAKEFERDLKGRIKNLLKMFRNWKEKKFHTKRVEESIKLLSTLKKLQGTSRNTQKI